MKRPGFTLVEITVAIVIITIAFYTLIAVFANLTPQAVNVEIFNKKVYLGQEKIEECLARNFDEINSVGPTSFPAPFNSYQYQIVVATVESGNLNTPVAGPTNYKNVKVRVWGGAANPAGSIEIVSLVTTTTYESH